MNDTTVIDRTNTCNSCLQKQGISLECVVNVFIVNIFDYCLKFLLNLVVLVVRTVLIIILYIFFCLLLFAVLI